METLAFMEVSMTIKHHGELQDPDKPNKPDKYRRCAVCGNVRFIQTAVVLNEPRYASEAVIAKLQCGRCGTLLEDGYSMPKIYRWKQPKK